jgi:hypothetical protein
MARIITHKDGLTLTTQAKTHGETTTITTTIHGGIKTITTHGELIITQIHNKHITKTINQINGIIRIALKAGARITILNLQDGDHKIICQAQDKTLTNIIIKIHLTQTTYQTKSTLTLTITITLTTFQVSQLIFKQIPTIMLILMGTYLKTRTPIHILL